MHNMPKVVYIMGTARSGSTILEILLSHGRGVFGAGEITSLIEDGFIENKPCSCGKSCRDCEVWGRVLEKLDMKCSEIEAWSSLQRKVDWHNGFLRQLTRILSQKDKADYKELNRRLLRAIAEVTGSAVIVDSSKYTGRAVALARIVDADVKVICLTRSPAGLMASFQKPNKEEQRPKGALATVVYYMIISTLLRLATMIMGRDKILQVSYESFLADPQATLRSIESLAGIELTDIICKLGKGEEFSIGHLVTGNRLRKKGIIRFNRSLSEHNHEGSVTRMLILLMNGWCRILGFWNQWFDFFEE